MGYFIKVNSAGQCKVRRVRVTPDLVRCGVKEIAQGPNWPTMGMFLLRQVMDKNELRDAFLQAYRELSWDKRHAMRERFGRWTDIEAQNNSKPKKPPVITREMFEALGLDQPEERSERKSAKGSLHRFASRLLHVFEGPR